MEKRKVHIGLFVQKAIDSTEEEFVKSRALAAKNAKKIEDFYRYYDVNREWDIQVRAYAMAGESNAHPPGYAKADIDRYMTDHPEEFADIGWKPNYWHVQGGYSAGYCGQGNKPGYRSVTYLHYACGAKTMIHELGHNFGLHHASTLSGETLVEYGDSTCVMGSSQAITGLCSVNLLQLGFETPREIKHVNSTQQVLICPQEMTANGMHDAEWQHIVIEDGSEPYHLSLRKTRGSRYVSQTQQEEVLYVYRATTDKHSVRLLPDLVPGRTKMLPNGTVINYLEYSNETARVNIFTNASDPAPDDIPMPNGFPIRLPTVTLKPKHTGSWFNPDFNGQGFDIHIKDDYMVLYWYTFDQRTNSRRFYFANCPTSEGMVEFDIKTTDNGTWTDPTTHEVTTVGKGQLYFYDDTHGLFNFNTYEHGRGSVALTPVTPYIDNDMNGIYYKPSRNGEGFTIQFFNSFGEDRCAAFWYSYGPPKRSSTVGLVPNSKQRWYSCEGNKNLDGTYDLTVYEVLDGKWMEYREMTQDPDKVGTAILTIVDDGSINFDYDIDADGVTGTGTFELEKLF